MGMGITGTLPAVGLGSPGGVSKENNAQTGINCHIIGFRVAGTLALNECLQGLLMNFIAFRSSPWYQACYVFVERLGRQHIVLSGVESGK